MCIRDRDVADELPDDFIEEIRRAVKRHGEDKYLLGEVWEDATNKWSYGRRRTYLLGKGLDAVMNYPFKEAAIGFAKGEDTRSVAERIVRICENYPAPALNTVMNFLSTHDTVRAITAMAGESCEGRDRYWQSGRRLTPVSYTHLDVYKRQLHRKRTGLVPHINGNRVVNRTGTRRAGATHREMNPFAVHQLTLTGTARTGVHVVQRTGPGEHQRHMAVGNGQPGQTAPGAGQILAGEFRAQRQCPGTQLLIGVRRKEIGHVQTKATRHGQPLRQTEMGDVLSHVTSEALLCTGTDFLLCPGLRRAEQHTGNLPVSYTHLDVYKRQVVGPLTWNKIYEVYTDLINGLLTADQRPGVYPGTPLRLGSTGRAVKEIQYLSLIHI